MNKTVFISLASVFTALYAGGVIIFAPISFGIAQVRLIDSIIPLSSIFGFPVVLGVSIGNIIANIYGGLGLIDVVGGTIANFLASAAAMYIRKKLIEKYPNLKNSLTVLSTFIAALIVTFIVGSYLSLIFYVPIEISLLSVFIGSLISMTIVGTILIILLEKSNINNILQEQNQ